MPVVDRREFGGRFDVVENARRLANYRYAEIQLMEMLGGWCHTTPEIALKAAWGHHVYDSAQNADLLGERLSQLRSQKGRAEAASDAFVRLCEKIWLAPDSLARLVGVYKVLKPHLVSTYVYHLESTDEMADAPTRRMLHQISALVQNHVLWGRQVIEPYLRDPAERKRALAWQAELERELVECGGVTGTGVEAHWLPYAAAAGGPVAERLLPHERRARRDLDQVRDRRAAYTFVKASPPLDHPVVEAPFRFSEEPEAHRATWTAPDPTSPDWFRERLHALLYGEIDTVDRMGKMLADFPDLPWAMRLDLARQAWDEARHIEIVAKALRETGAEFGFAPWHSNWWKHTQNQADPLERLAVNNCWAEANLCKTLHDWMREAAEAGNHKLAELFDYLLADEIVHVDFGTHWIRELTIDDPGRREALAQWAKKTACVIEGFSARIWGRPEPTPAEMKLSF